MSALRYMVETLVDTAPCTQDYCDDCTCWKAGVLRPAMAHPTIARLVVSVVADRRRGREHIANRWPGLPLRGRGLHRKTGAL